MKLPNAFDQHWPLLHDALAALTCDAPPILIAAAATVQVECATWIPQAEKRADPTRQPDLYRLQQRYWPSGYYARGFLGHTWQRNYARLEKALGLPLLAKPDLLLEPPIAASALAWQFQADGAAKAACREDWEQVRRIVNGPRMLHLDRFLEAIAFFSREIG